jgi:hypothetical protein
MMIRKRGIPVMVGVALLALGLTESGAQERVWVASEGARLQAEQTAESPTVVRLPLETALTVIAREGKWYRVRTDGGETGWIYRGKVSGAKPGDDTAELDDLLGDLGESDILLAAADTSRSVRGVMDDPEEGEAMPIPEPYRSAVDRVLSFYVGDAELRAFLKEGGIGEYAP